ncbi:MAG: aldehyde dehydrogenase family protein [Oscillospiraceae bacterium]|jgi:betaine-aldehyde dehydrogenase|nr:aldehyde dehydrogenase family protein [Oscillospiraceae bacterium]
MTEKLMYIGGEWVKGAGTREVFNPADGTKIGIVTDGTAEDVKKAVAAARAAFPAWAGTSVTARAALLLKIADRIEELAEEFAAIDTADNGKPLRDSLGDATDSAACFRYYAGLIDKPSGQTYLTPDPENFAMTVREPIGVVGQIAPWNYPLMMAAWKIAPCIAAGNTTVFKPSTLTALSSVRLFELFDEVGLPAGVANLVLGSGATVGQEIAENPGVDKVVFTGGTDTGRQIMKTAAETIKGVGLELGGKSPCVIFDDVDTDIGVDWALFAIFCNQGEVCSAGSRLILQDTIYDEFLEKLAARAEKIKVARGDEPGSEMGPLVSEEHMNSVLAHIETAKSQGARLITGGYRLTDGELAKGWFVAPTIFADCTPDMAIVQKEVFGPVLAVQKFHTEDEAIELANGTDFGLAAGVFSNDIARAMRVVRAFRAGITWVNSYHPTFTQAPWGGYKQSGIGRELGTYGLEEYTEVKQININLAPGRVDWFEN